MTILTPLHINILKTGNTNETCLCTCIHERWDRPCLKQHLYNITTLFDAYFVKLIM